METWTRERLLDVIAREVGISRAEVRLRNMIGPDELPNQMITGPALDVRMSAKATLERALEVAEFGSWRRRRPPRAPRAAAWGSVSPPTSRRLRAHPGTSTTPSRVSVTWWGPSRR